MFTEDNYKSILNKNVYFYGNYKKVKQSVKKYIEFLSKGNGKVILLDSYWTMEYYKRFKRSRYLKEIERRYHIKVSVEKFLQKHNIIDYMNHKNINILKVKSIEGFTSAAELFPFILNKINKSLKDETVYILLNDFVLDYLSDEEFRSLNKTINNNLIKYIVISKKRPKDYILDKVEHEILIK